ncbi:phage Gp37/Gp68 family protein [uncultured Arenimonas sp.]|uniref:DUF5131 family protein n=1 Tax=uncultured Arenimonas sp. TaxID=546226 RepID=UPI0030DC739E
MADHTHIEWTDATWNPITGCSVVSAGCKHCYAMKLAGTRLQHHPSRAGLTVETKAGPVWNGQVRLNEEWLDQPLRWRRPRRIFVCAHGDLFHENVPDEWIDRVFMVMRYAPEHSFQVLSKRPARMLSYLQRFKPSPAWDGYVTRDGVPSGERPADAPLFFRDAWPLPNVWLGVSVEDQAAADERIPLLLQTPAAVRWISAEPLLGAVDLRDALDEEGHESGGPQGWVSTRAHGIDWVVAGGESGAGARPMHPDWARSLRDQCAAAGVPFLFKQWGEWQEGSAGSTTTAAVLDDGRVLHNWTLPAMAAADRQKRVPTCRPTVMARVGKKAAGRLLDGQLHDDYPVDA